MAEQPDPPDDFLHSLNDAQKSAVMHQDNPLLIVAGAGTGKTTTLAHRVAWQVISGVSPERILLLTFSRRAASEMLRRVESILNDLDSSELPHSAVLQKGGIRRIAGGTFHATAMKLLRRHGSLLGLNPDFTVLDRGDSEDLMNLARARLNLPKTPKGKSKAKDRFPLKGTCIDIYSRCVNTQGKLEPVLIKSFPWCIPFQDKLAELFKLYSEFKEQQRVLDFDDLLLFWKALAESPEGQAILTEQYDRIMVDEYQDTNVLQSAILKAMTPHGIGLTAVGDDAQSIYSFRAATIRNILDFPDHFPNTTVIPLEQNYRSTQSVLHLTNAVIADAKERHAKNLWSDRTEGQPPVLATCASEDDQSAFVIDTILEQLEKGVALAEQCVLFRASHHSMALEAELSRRQIPFQKFGGLRFLEAAHIKDVMSFLRLIENPFDVIAGLRALLLIPGIGQVKAGQLLDHLSAAGGQFESWAGFKVPTAARETWPGFVKLLRDQSARKPSEDSTVAAEMHAVRNFYSPMMKLKYDGVRGREADLKQLEVMASRYRQRADFLSEMTLDPPSSSQELKTDSVDIGEDDMLSLSTIHSAKGLEWDSVFVLHASDGCIPSEQSAGSDEELEEERRLFYVALTRAKNHLFVSRSERALSMGRRRGGPQFSAFSKISRFLPAATQTLCDKQTYGDVMGDFFTNDFQDSIGDTSEIRRQINDLWS
ncbi:MAG: ATP-dependent helicase [Fuerstiella sp.]